MGASFSSGAQQTGNAIGQGYNQANNQKKGIGPMPDYKGAAEATAEANRPNQSTPWANSQWAKGPDGQWTQKVGFGAPMQSAVDSLQQQMADTYSKPMDDGSAARDAAITSGYNQATSRLDPRFAQGQEQLNSSLANQGLDANSQAFRTAQQQFGQNKNDAYTSALASAIANGNQAQALTFGQNLQARMAPLQQLQGMQGFLQMPGFQAGPNYLAAQQLAGQYGMDASNLRQEGMSDAMGGLGGLLGAGLSMGTGGKK